MGTVDIENAVEELTQSDNIFWDEERLSFEQFQSILKQAIEEVTEYHYSRNDGEIDDWDIWESDVINKANKLLGNDD